MSSEIKRLCNESFRLGIKTFKTDILLWEDELKKATGFNAQSASGGNCRWIISVC